MKKELMLYLHLPFCVRKCRYCDFLSGSYSGAQVEEYLGALLREIERTGRELTDYCVSSIFFGGGTPSLLSGTQLLGLMERLTASFSLRNDIEITMEGNPGTFTPERLRAYRSAGVNRLSIGCQSVHDEELAMLGRIHTFADFQKSFEMARAAGFSNLNVDLMSGLPNQTRQGWEESLRTIAGCSPEHISAYSLIVEEGTPFAEMELSLPEEDDERWMYEQTAEILGEYGYHRYEISNYAKDGRECRHNLGYWQRKNYLGLGAGAASLLGNERFSNTADLKTYIESGGDPGAVRRERNALSKKEQMEETMFLGLRMRDGVLAEDFHRRFGVTPKEIYAPVLEKYERLGLLRTDGGRIVLTKAGISVSNVILADFLLD